MKIKVRDLAPEDQMMRKLVRKFPDMNIVFDIAPGVYVVPVILEKETTAKPGYAGVLEYQVSDGIPGERGTSYDVYSLREAREIAATLQLYGGLPRNAGGRARASRSGSPGFPGVAGIPVGRVAGGCPGVARLAALNAESKHQQKENQ